MSKLPSIATLGKSEQNEQAFEVRIHQHIAQEIDSIAARRRMKRDDLVSEILEQYVMDQHSRTKQSGASFLLSLAGMFDSGKNAASEEVKTIVLDFISAKHNSKAS